MSLGAVRRWGTVNVCICPNSRHSNQRLSPLRATSGWVHDRDACGLIPFWSRMILH